MLITLLSTPEKIQVPQSSGLKGKQPQIIYRKSVSHNHPSKMGTYVVNKRSSNKRKLLCGSAKNILRKLRQEEDQFVRYSSTLSNLTSSCSSWSNISDLLSVKSLKIPEENPPFLFTSIVSEELIRHCKKKSRIDENTSLVTEYDDHESIPDLNATLLEEENQRESVEIALLEKIKKFKNEPSTINTKKEVLALVRQYKIIRTCTSLTNWNLNRTADLCLKKLHFPELPQKIGQQDYFLLITCGTDVKTSRITKSTTNYITFEEEFVFQWTTLNFKIQIELYAVKLTAKINCIVKKMPVMEKLVKWYKSKKSPDLFESSSFTLVDRFDLTREDLTNETIGAIKAKHFTSKPYKYSLEVLQVHVECEKSGPLRYYSHKEEAWKKLFCELDETSFKIYENGSCLSSFDLRYATYARIDEDGTMCVKSVSPSKSAEDTNSIRLKSRDNFVVTSHQFKACYINYLMLWCDAINDVVESLDCWKSTFLYRDELLHLN